MTQIQRQDFIVRHRPERETVKLERLMAFQSSQGIAQPAGAFIGAEHLQAIGALLDSADPHAGRIGLVRIRCFSIWR